MEDNPYKYRARAATRLRKMGMKQPEIAALMGIKTVTVGHYIRCVREGRDGY